VQMLLDAALLLVFSSRCASLRFCFGGCPPFFIVCNEFLHARGRQEV
jgi:hypothetical protein